MCNAFGGIMFLAMTVVVISAQLPDSVTDEEMRRKYEQTVTRLETQIRDTRQELAIADMDVAQRGDLLKFGEGNQSPELISEFFELSTEQEILQSRNRMLVASLETLSARDAELGESLAEQRRRLDEQSQQLQALQDIARKADLEASKMQDELNMPMEASSVLDLEFARLQERSLVPCWMILDGGKLYRINRPGSRLGGGTSCEHSSDVIYEWNPHYLRLRFEPAPGRGMEVNEKSARALDAVFSPVSKSSFFIHVHVRDDSFPQWGHLRRFFREAGFRYDWTPLISGEPVDLIISDDVTYESY